MIINNTLNIFIFHVPIEVDVGVCQACLTQCPRARFQLEYDYFIKIKMSITTT